MKRNPSFDEVRSLLESGTLPKATLAGLSAAELEIIGAVKMRWIVATMLGMPLERITIQVVDVGVAGKVGMLASFFPELTEEEEALYELAMRALAAALGSRPPVKMASA